MSGDESKWYLPGPDNQPVGPLTADQVFHKWRAAEISNNTLVWADGLGDWQPLAEVEPFVTAIRKIQDCIRFRCPQGHEIIMGRQFAGRSAKCKRCGAVVNVPDDRPPPPPPPRPPGGRDRVRWVVAAGVLVVIAGGVAALLLGTPKEIRKAEALLAQMFSPFARSLSSVS